MAISKQTDYWTARLAGPTHPESPVGSNNQAWTLDDGLAGDYELTDNSFRVLASSGTDGQRWKIEPTWTNDGWTVIIAFSCATSISATDTLLTIENDVNEGVTVDFNAATGAISLNGPGISDPAFTGVDLTMSDDYPVPVVLRLTMTDTKARLYLNEVVEDDDAATAYLETSLKSGLPFSAPTVRWGSFDNDVDFYAVYFTQDGAFSPDEMDMSDFTSQSLMRTGMKVVEVLRNSRRLYLNNHVGSSGIFYGYDLSSNAMVNRTPSPTVHVMVQKTDSPDFLTLAGTRTDQRYDVNVFIVTRGTNYENAYRMGATILGEVFDELYTQTGLQAGVDSLVSYNAVFDTKVDDDETVCVHSLTLTYMKKVRMFLREV